MSKTNNTAAINVNVETHTTDSERIPKFVELFDESLRTIKSQWYESNHFSIDHLKPGTYTLRLSMSSGIQDDETFELDKGEVKDIHFNIATNSPHESHEWAYFNKNFSRGAGQMRGANLKAIDYYQEQGKIVSGDLWRYKNGSWYSEMMPEFSNQVIRKDGFTFNISTGYELSVLEVTGDGMENQYTCLSPGSNLNILVKLSEARGEDEDVHPIDVTVSSDNFRAETLLTLLTTGAMREASKLSNAEQAEGLLYSKMTSPAMAAIGGYFLLKIGELQRLHDWANNLANWFEWLPDGSIIHATQLLSKKDKTKEDIKTIRERLLDAASNGIPVYAEGLRLLEKGLTQLWYHFKRKDKEIEEALKKVGKYMETYDYTQETTTFIGISPTEPKRMQSLPLNQPTPVVVDTDNDQRERRRLRDTVSKTINLKLPI